MSEISGKAFDFKAFRRILEYLRPYKMVAGFTLLTSVLLAALAPVMPIFIKYIENTAIKLGRPAGFPFPIKHVPAVICSIGCAELHSVFEYLFYKPSGAGYY